jgi:hypothetical protein
VVGSDGTPSPFSIPEGTQLVITDISIERGYVLGAPELVFVNLIQTPPDSIVARWSFVGEVSQNVERTFTTGMVFSTPLQVQNGIEDENAEAVTVRLWGFTELAP